MLPRPDSRNRRSPAGSDAIRCVARGPAGSASGTVIIAFLCTLFRPAPAVLLIPASPPSARMGLVMGSLSPRLQVRVAQKQILTPGLVQMVSLLQLNRLELKDMISAEVAQNPVLEEGADGSEELTPEELQPLLEADGERSGESADQSILDVTAGPPEFEGSQPDVQPPALAG